MKSKIILAFSLIFFILSCKKNTGISGRQQSGGTTLVRIQEGTDSDMVNDTVYLISYNSSGKISQVLDSLYEDSLVASYNGSGNLDTVNDIGAFSLGNSSFTYDANNLLTQINCSVAGENEQYIFEYTSGIVSKKSYYSDFGLGGALQLYSYDVYTVSNGNITDMKEYDAGNNLTSETTFTYGSQANPFKLLGLFNFGNRLGTQDIISYETYFNKNILAGYSIIGGATATATNTFNSNQEPTEIIMNDQVNQWLLTWQFSYK